MARDPPRALGRADRPRHRRRAPRRGRARAADRVDAARGRGARRRVLPERPGPERLRAPAGPLRGGETLAGSTRRKPWAPCMSELGPEEELERRRSPASWPRSCGSSASKTCSSTRSSTCPRSATGGSASRRTRRRARSSADRARHRDAAGAHPVLEDFLPRELVASFEEQVANLQLAYAKAAKETVPTAEIGVFGGSGFYSFLEDVEEVEVDTPYGSRRRPSPSARSRAASRVPAAARPASTSCRRTPIPTGERLGDARAGRAEDHRPERVRCAQGRARAGRVRRLRPVRRPDERPRGHVLRRPRDDPCLRRRPVLP